MTKGLDDFLNLPSLEDALRDKGLLDVTDASAASDAANPALEQVISLAQAADRHTQMLEGSDHAKAMDEMYAETRKHAQDIIDLGFNMDPARSARLFEVAAGMYSRAIDAKNAKRDSQLKAMKLALEQRRLALDEKRFAQVQGAGDPVIEQEANVVVEDRNELIRRLREQINRKGD